MKRRPEGLRCRDHSAEPACPPLTVAQQSAACPSGQIAQTGQKVGGFTLTEVLVVAVVIGVLLSFITAAAFSALTRGQEFAIQTEVGKLAMAMEAFKQQYGSYPPADLTPPSNAGKKDRLYSFVARAFPRHCHHCLDHSPPT